ncbi:cell division cycle and apoptosis regulator protein [Salix suchowensis]|nr:cell division cycle and apoptosis regulator protein [Salix suchowensis]
MLMAPHPVCSILRGAAGHHTAYEVMSFGGRMDANPRNSSLHSSSTYKGQHAPSIPGAAPKRSFDDLLYPQSSPNPGHGEEESEAEEVPEEDPEESEEMEDPEEYEQMDDLGMTRLMRKGEGKTSRMLSMSLWLKVETELSGKEAVIDKELLEAFRFFDWNQTGYIRV